MLFAGIWNAIRPVTPVAELLHLVEPEVNNERGCNKANDGHGTGWFF
jgi:hypothetical protein